MPQVATNQKFYDMYNEYMATHTLTEARTDGWLKLDQQIVPINYDMFFGFLVDKIVLSVINDHAFIDKLDNLYGRNLDYGAVIESNMTVLKSKNYEFDTQNFETDVENPFKKSKKGLVVNYHHITDHKKIRVTVSYDQLKTGCMSDNGVDGIVRNMLNDARVEYSAWAYAEKKKALSLRNYVQVVTFKDYADFNLKLKDVKIDVTNYDDSWKHNGTLLFTPTSEDNLAIIMSERFKNKVDINVFTGLFNVSYAELKDRIIYIDQFDDPEIVCGIYDKRGFEFHRVLDTTREIINGEDLSRTQFIHFWRMHSVDNKYTAVVFKEEASDVLDDVSMLVKGYKDDNTGFTSNTTFTAPFDGKYQIGTASPVTFSQGDTITVNNPQSISPVTLVMTKQNVTTVGEGQEAVTTRTDIASCLYRIRFEYPSKIDATLGHPKAI